MSSGKVLFAERIREHVEVFILAAMAQWTCLPRMATRELAGPLLR